MVLRAFVFDVEGTLIDCARETIASWQATLAEAGVTASTEELQTYSGMGGNDMLNVVAPSLSRAKRARLIRAHGARYRAEYLREVRAFPGVRRLFQAIKRRDGLIALATDCEADELHRYREVMDGENLIDTFACGEDVKKEKPNPDLLRIVLQRLKLSPAEAVMIGDTPFDAQAALTLGASAWGVLSGGHSESVLRKNGCARVFGQVGDIVRDEALLLSPAPQS